VKTVPTSLPGHLIDSYWEEVEVLLVKRFRASRADARSGIDKYRKAMTQHGVGDLLYHAGAEETARGIRDGGYLT
jgi:hypothetical protein